MVCSLGCPYHPMTTRLLPQVFCIVCIYDQYYKCYSWDKFVAEPPQWYSNSPFGGWKQLPSSADAFWGCRFSSCHITRSPTSGGWTSWSVMSISLFKLTNCWIRNCVNQCLYNCPCSKLPNCITWFSFASVITHSYDFVDPFFIELLCILVNYNNESEVRYFL